MRKLVVPYLVALWAGIVVIVTGSIASVALFALEVSGWRAWAAAAVLYAGALFAGFPSFVKQRRQIARLEAEIARRGQVVDECRRALDGAEARCKEKLRKSGENYAVLLKSRDANTERLVNIIRNLGGTP